MDIFILCHDVDDWQIVLNVCVSEDIARRLAQAHFNGDYMDAINHRMEDAIEIPALQWSNPDGQSKNDVIRYGNRTIESSKGGILLNRQYMIRKQELRVKA